MNCQCCGLEPAVGVASIPGLPMSIAWGRNCLDAGIMPYWALVTTVALASNFEYSPDHYAPWVNELIRDTLAYFDKTEAQFAEDVNEEINDIANEFLPTEEV